MSTPYQTADGEMLDKIIWNFYGSLRPGMVEKVLVANPGLADYGPVLPSGVVINLPEILEEPTRTKRLWS